MTGKQYENYIRLYRKKPALLPAIKTGNKILTLLGYVTYPLLIFYLFYRKDPALFRYILIPGIAFVAVSIFRKIYNRPRPYEDPEIHALCPRDKKGQSFPSRHVFSFFLIAVLACSLLLPLGICLLVSGILLAYLRVILGVHYPMDVLVGAFLGILAGLITVLSFI